MKSSEQENKQEKKKRSLPKEAQPYMWKPGQSGNPGGRPVKKPITELFERIMNDPALVAKFEESITRSIMKGGMAGVMYVKEAADRIEGKVTQPIEADITVQNLANTISIARKRLGNE